MLKIENDKRNSIEIYEKIKDKNLKKNKLFDKKWNLPRLIKNYALCKKFISKLKNHCHLIMPKWFNKYHFAVINDLGTII